MYIYWFPTRVLEWKITAKAAKLKVVDGCTDDCVRKSKIFVEILMNLYPGDIDVNKV
jgi:hypothetical protein